MSGYFNAGMSFQTGQVTVQLSGIDAPETTIIWKLLGGKMVSLLIDANGVSTSNSTDLEVPGGTFPEFLRPVGDTRLIPCSVVDSGVRKIGRADIPSSGGGLAGGIIFMAPDADGALGETNFTASGLKGVVPGTEITYVL